MSELYNFQTVEGAYPFRDQLFLDNLKKDWKIDSINGQMVEIVGNNIPAGYISVGDSAVDFIRGNHYVSGNGAINTGRFSNLQDKNLARNADKPVFKNSFFTQNYISGQWKYPWSKLMTNVNNMTDSYTRLKELSLTEHHLLTLEDYILADTKLHDLLKHYGGSGQVRKISEIARKILPRLQELPQFQTLALTDLETIIIQEFKNSFPNDLPPVI